MDTDSPRLRLSILAVVVLSLFGALFARLWYLQVMVADQFQVEAAANRVRTVAIEAPRGRILDAKGRVIVDNRTSLVVTINPKDFNALTTADQNDLLLRVAEQLTQAGNPTKVVNIRAKLSDPQYNGLQPIPIAIDVPDTLFQYFAEWADQYPSVAVQRQSVRSYPLQPASTAAHIVGYVGRISGDELVAKQGGVTPTKPIDKPYQPDSEIGKTGVERAYESYLRGTPGIQTIEVDAKGRPVRTVSEQAPQPGDDVQLSIDIDVQRSAEDALSQQLAALQGKRQPDGTPTKAPAGSVVALDPTNGNVIAMASYPTYDPSQFVNGISQSQYDQLTKGGDENNPLINRAIAGQYAPGSTFKLVTATAALQRGMITANTSYPDNGSYTIIGCNGGKGCETRHNSGGEANGNISLPTAITVSSDVYFYWLGDRFYEESAKYGATAIQDTAKAYGLGQASGIPLLGESKGLVLDAQLAKQRHDENPLLSDGTWYAGNNVNLAIGQDVVLVTPLQLTNAYATFANHGTLYQPQVVLRVLKSHADPNDPASVVMSTQANAVGHVDLPPNIYDPLNTGFQGAIDSPKGTAHAAFQGFDTSAFTLAGKTGTAQVTGKADTSLFVSYGPVGGARYVVGAVLEESGFGASAAAPVVRHVWETLSNQALTAVVPTQAGTAG